MKQQSDMSAIKNANFNAILNAMRGGHAALADIAAVTALSIPTVKKAVDFAMASGMVRSARTAASTGGRKARLYAVNADYAGYLYFALDDDTLHYILRDFTGAVRVKAEKVIRLPEFCEQMERVVRETMESGLPVALIAIAVPAIVNDGTVTDWYYNPSLRGVSLQAYFRQRFSCSVVVENDMKLTAIAAAAHTANPASATLATLQFEHNGIGVGLMVNGMLLRGAEGFAGEVSFLSDFGEYAISAEYSAKIVNALLVFINPEVLVFYAVRARAHIEGIVREAAQGLPAYAVPRVVVADDYLKDVFAGLETVAVPERSVMWA